MEKQIEKLLFKMKELHIDAMLIASKSNRRYMSGFTGSSAMLYISEHKRFVITDFRYMEQAGAQCNGFEVINQGEMGMLKTAMKAAQEEAVRYIGFESAHTNYTTFLELKAYDAFEFIPTQNVIEELRQIKDEEELQKIRMAEHIGDLAFAHIVPFIEEKYLKGITENEVALELEYFMRQNGAADTSFASIVAAGSRSSLPHAEPGKDMLKHGDFVVMDFGCIYEGYCSDMTRTIVMGEPTKKHKEIYDIVLRAQLKALEIIRPGMTGKEIDAAARQVIASAGYGDYFGHGLGHSLGLDIHESPRFSPLDASCIRAGMVMTVEPGIYLPGFGGVRIEDLVLVTDTGIENLTHSPKELIAVK